MPFSLRDVPITIIQRPALRLTATEVKLFLTMTDKLLSAIKAKLEIIIATAERIPLPPDNVSPREQIIIHRRKGESPRKRHGLITIEVSPQEPLP
jgi:hypothetical protein